MTTAIVRAQVDQRGALVAADAPLLRLQRLAGSDLGADIALPQLAQLISVCLTDQRSVAHTVMLGDDGQMIQGWAAIFPHSAGADIAIRDWSSAAMSRQSNGRTPERTPSLMGWSWESDADLCLIALRLGENAPPVEADWAGRRLTDLLQFQLGPDGTSAIEVALQRHLPFSAQTATVACGGEYRHEILLSGQPIFDAVGGFCGYRGAAEPASNMDIHQCPYFRASQEGGQELRFNKRIDDALRVPLNRIITTADAITEQREGLVRADYARYAGDIAQAGRHLLGLVDDLVDVQHIERPDFTVASDVLDLAELARSAAGLLRIKAEEKNIRIFAPHASESLSVTGEHRRVLQILINLLTNAVRYSPAGTDIHVTLDAGLIDTQVSVLDQGCGLSAEQQKLIFEKFERLGRRDSGGSGLGLYIARKLARAMKGDLRVSSEIEQGSCFTLSLPTHLKN